MDPNAALHLAALSFTFASVASATYGLLRQLVAIGLWPLHPTEGRSLWRELAWRLGTIAVANNWFQAMRDAAARDVPRARHVGFTPADVAGESLAYALLGGCTGYVLSIAAGAAIWNVLPAIALAFVLFHVPAWRLRSAADQRVRFFTRRLPYSLEVVVLATEAGASLEEAIRLLVREDPASPLHEELDQVLRDMQLGVKRRDAWRAMSSRIATDDLSALVMAMDVAEDLGTPSGEVLKQQAVAIQNSRIKRAERLSHEAAPKMAVPNTMIMVANVLLILAPFLPKLSLGSGL